MDETDFRRDGSPSLEMLTTANDEETTKFETQSIEIKENPDEIIEEKRLCCFTLWQVKRCTTEGGREKMIEINVTVESLRFATNLSFFILILLGVITTHTFGKKTLVDYRLKNNGTEIQKTILWVVKR